MKHYTITVRLPGLEPEVRTATINGETAVDAMEFFLKTVLLVYGIEGEVISILPRGRVVLGGKKEKDNG
jgi:hypothetical protein